MYACAHARICAYMRVYARACMRHAATKIDGTSKQVVFIDVLIRFQEHFDVTSKLRFRNRCAHQKLKQKGKKAGIKILMFQGNFHLQEIQKTWK